MTWLGFALIACAYAFDSWWLWLAGVVVLLYDLARSTDNRGEKRDPPAG